MNKLEKIYFFTIVPKFPNDIESYIDKVLSYTGLDKKIKPYNLNKLNSEEKFATIVQYHTIDILSQFNKKIQQKLNDIEWLPHKFIARKCYIEMYNKQLLSIILNYEKEHPYVLDIYNLYKKNKHPYIIKLKYTILNCLFLMTYMFNHYAYDIYDEDLSEIDGESLRDGIDEFNEEPIYSIEEVTHMFDKYTMNY